MDNIIINYDNEIICEGDFVWELPEEYLPLDIIWVEKISKHQVDFRFINDEYNEVLTVAKGEDFIRNFHKFPINHPINSFPHEWVHELLKGKTFRTLKEVVF